MAYNYYEEAEQIASELAAQSHTMLAALVRMDVSEGSTATEILMALRHDLGQAKDDPRVESATRLRIKELIGQINMSLAP